MNKELNKKQSKKLTFKTFKKCLFKDGFSAEIDEQGYVLSLSLARIKNEARLRGIWKALGNVDNYADGVASIHLANVEENVWYLNQIKRF